MKRYIKSSTIRQTLREYLEANRDRLQGQNLVIADLTPYPEAEPDEDGYTECPGVLFDGDVDYLLNDAPETADIPVTDWPGDIYLTQGDLDRCYIKDVKSYPGGESIEIGGFFK